MEEIGDERRARIAQVDAIAGEMEVRGYASCAHCGGRLRLQKRRPHIKQRAAAFPRHFADGSRVGV